MTIWTGIDPGISGAIYAIDNNLNFSMSSIMPVTNKEIDPHLLIAFFINLKMLGQDIFVGMERTCTLPKHGAFASHNSGLNAGMIHGIIYSAGFKSFQLIHPRKWQKEIWQGTRDTGNPKDRSLQAVNRLFPTLNVSHRGKVHDGLVDALCIAEYTRRIFTGAARNG